MRICSLISHTAIGCGGLIGGWLVAVRLVITSAPAAEPETSNTTSAPAPPVRSRIAAGRSAAAGSTTSSPRLRGQTPPERVHLAQQHVAPRALGDEADQQADRPAADHDDGLAGGDLAAADVVAGDRQRLDERGQSQVDGPAAACGA